MVLILSLLSLIAVVNAASAAASTKSETVTIPATDTDYSQVVQIPQFDQSQGILRSVDVTLTAVTEGQLQIENTSTSSASTGTVELGATVTVASVDVPAVAVTPALPADGEVFSLGVFDGTIDFAGTSGMTFPDLVGTDTTTATFTDPADLAAFIGTGTSPFNVSAVATGSANATGGNIVLEFETTASAEISITYQFDAPSIDIEKTPDLQTIPFNGDATFTIAVTNNGEADLFNVTVTDPITPDCDRVIGDLAVGETVTYTCVFSGATADFVNVATVVGEDVLGNQVTDEDDAVVNVIAPEIQIVKSPDDQTIVFGGDAFFTIDVTNIGDLDLFDVTVTDPLVPDCDLVIGDLAIGETRSYTCEALGLLADFTNVADVVGRDIEGNVVTDSDDAPVNVLAPAIDIEKTPDDQTIVVGSNATFTITVTNIGDVDLFNVVVTDPLLPQCDTTVPSLAVGESFSYDCTAENVFEGFTNVATVTAEDEEGNPVDDTDDAILRVREPDIGQLPVTGSDNSELIITGLLMVLLGAVLVRMSRTMGTEPS